MQKTKDIILKFKNFHAVFIILMLIIILVGCFIIYSDRSYATQRWVKSYLAEYGSVLTELDMKIISENLSKDIEEQFSHTVSSDEFEREVMKIMTSVNSNLQYANFTLSQEDISSLTTKITEEVLAKQNYSLSEESKDIIRQYEKQLLEIQSHLNNLENKYDNIRNLQATSEISAATGIDESMVCLWLKTIQDNMELLQDETAGQFDELAKRLQIDSETLKKLLNEAAQTKDSITYLTQKLNITEEKLANVLSGINVSQDDKLAVLAQDFEDFQKEIIGRMDNEEELTKNRMTNVQNQINQNKDETDKMIWRNHASTQQQLYSNQKESKESLNKLQESMEKNFLFYSYDDNSNTLYLFDEKGG